MTKTLDVIVVGAGVVGMATALTLADRGHRVTIVDSAEGPGLGTSFANGAQLSYAYTDALASPATLLQLPRLLLGADPAFRLTPRIDPDFLKWGLAFLRNASAGRFLRNTLAGLELALQSKMALERLVARHNLSFSRAAPGKIHIYRSAKGFAAARKLSEIKSAHGIRQIIVDSEGAIAAEPMLHAVRHEIVGALHTPSEEVGDPYQFCTAVQSALAAAGAPGALYSTAAVALEADTRRPEVVTSAGRRLPADRIVLCAGMASARLGRTMGVRLPIQPMKGYSITVSPGQAAPTASITDVSNKVVFARLGNRMRIAGLADLGARDTRIEPSRLSALKASARTALPDAADYDGADSAWAGLRPMTPDSLPITRIIAPGIIANTGHGALGWTYAAGSAERVARLLDHDG